MLPQHAPASKRRGGLPAFRPGHELEVELDARGGGISAVREALASHFDALREELKAIELDEQEALLVCDALAVGRVTTQPPDWVWFLPGRVSEEIARRPDMAGRYPVDHARLIAKLRTLTYTQRLAVIDACRRVGRGGDVYSVGLAHKVREQERPG